MEDRKDPVDYVAETLDGILDGVGAAEAKAGIDGLLEHLQARALVALNNNPDSPETVRYAREFWVFAEMTSAYASLLKAIDDSEEEMLSDFPANGTDDDDDGPSGLPN